MTGDQWKTEIIRFLSDDGRHVFAKGVALADLFGVVPMWQINEEETVGKPRRRAPDWWIVVHLPSDRIMGHFPGEMFARGFCSVLAGAPERWTFQVWQGTEDEKQALKRQWSDAGAQFFAYGST